MSYLQEISKPIEISNNNYNLSYSGFNNNNFFLLEIHTGDNILYISKNEINNYSNLINSYDNIKFSRIIKYKLTLSNIIVYDELEGYINHDVTYNVNNNNNLFIEFTHDDNDNTKCVCYYTKSNMNILCISPPN